MLLAGLKMGIRKEVPLLRGFPNGQTTSFTTCGAPSLLGEHWDVPGSEGSTAAWGEETSVSMWICSYSYTPVFRIEMKYLSAEQLEKIDQADPCRGDAPLISQLESFPTGIVFSSKPLHAPAIPEPSHLLCFLTDPLGICLCCCQSELTPTMGLGFISHMCSSSSHTPALTPALFPRSLKEKGMFFSFADLSGCIFDAFSRAEPSALHPFPLQPAAAHAPILGCHKTSKGDPPLLQGSFQSKIPGQEEMASSCTRAG